MSKLPLNGTKTHPLSAFALEVLKDLVERPSPSSAINPGVANRLLREELVESVDLPSPYVSHKGKNVEHLRITAEGRNVLQARGLLKST